MKSRTFFLILLSAIFWISCGQKAKDPSVKVEYIEVSTVEVFDDVSPPKDAIVNTKTMQEWFSSICRDKKPKTSIGTYKFGLFESPHDYTLYFYGVNEYHHGDTLFNKIEFKPSNMYFRLSENEFNYADREQLISQLEVRLRELTSREPFISSFLSNADSIVIASNGKSIWVRPRLD